MNPKRAIEICASNGLSLANAWRLYKKTKNSFKKSYSDKQATMETIKEIGRKLKIDISESRALYNFLYAQTIL